MFIRIWNKALTNYKDYESIKNLSFSPEIDMTGQTISIDEFYVDIETTDPVIIGSGKVGEISTSRLITLLDDRDRDVWAEYKIVLAIRLDDNFVRVQAQSVLAKLDKRMVKAKMYENDLVSDIFSNLFKSNEYYSLDHAFDSARITGYCPKQTAKERLQMICFAIGAIVRTSFNQIIEIISLDDTEKVVPIEKVYWKPSISYHEYVTSINVTSFTFTEVQQPVSGEEYVKADGKFYVVGRTENSLDNPNAQQGTDTMEITIDDMYLVNSGNVDEIMSHLALTYFTQMELDADIVNNADYKPTELIGVPVDPADPTIDSDIMFGYVDSCSFTFGLQAKSRIHMMVQEIRQTTRLIINYMKNNTRLGRKLYNFPVGYVYSIQNPYLDQSTGRHRYVYYPKNKNATGTINPGTNVNNQPYDIALHYYGDTNILEIISVTDVKWQDDDREVMSIE